MENGRVFLLPGEYHVSRTACQMATLLGSCVSVCLSHVSQPYAAMNHFLLAEAPASESDKGRYGNLATETILWLMRKLDATPRTLEARIYGGAAVVGHLGAQSDIGTRNILIARSVLKANGVPIREEVVGGTHGRRIYFDTAAKQVTVREIQKTEEVRRMEQKRRDIATRASRVLIVDDSPLVRKILRQAVEGTEDLVVAGEAGDAYEARDLILSCNPDVISLDIIMPRLDGLKFLKKLTEHFPKPVVICSTIAKDNSDIARRAKELGAVDVVDKDQLHLYKGLDVVRQVYIPKLRHAAHKVVRKRLFD